MTGAMRAARPAGRQRRAALIAQHMAAQGEVLVDIGLAGRIDAAIEPVQDFAVGIERDQRLMLPFA
nr:hypothetical protein [Oceanibaculum pacificum]